MGAFDVRLKDHKRNLATKARVVFETVDLNEGLGYNASNGIFTAPSGGIYVFDWTTLVWKGQSAYTSLVVNDKFKSWNHCRGVDSKTWLPCSKTTVVKLKEGDEVWIGVNSGSKYKVKILCKYISQELILIMYILLVYCSY